MLETWVQSLAQEDLLEKEMATHSSVLTWRIPRMEEHGRLQSMGSQRVGHDSELHFASKEHPGLISFRMDWLDLLAVQGTLKSLLQHHSSKASILQRSCGSTGKESAHDAGDLGLIPRLGRSPGEGKGYPLQYSGLENSMDCIAQEIAKSGT